MIYPPEFVTDTTLRIDPLWAVLGDPVCYDVVTGLQRECPAPEPPSSSLETGDMRFFGDGDVVDLSGEELAQIALPRYAVRMALSSDHTRLWVEYSDETLGLWGVMSE
jgi:hypothetical protein